MKDEKSIKKYLISDPRNSKKIFSIISILNDFEIVINGGFNNGISKGDLFNILDNSLRKLIDPTSQEVLDSFVGFKYQMQAKHVEEKYSILETLKIEDPLISYKKHGFASLRETREHLNFDRSEKNDIFESFSHAKIHVGDKVVVKTKHK